MNTVHNYTFVTRHTGDFPGVSGLESLRLRSEGVSADSMSDKKNNAPMPASSAGLLTFFNEATNGVKVRPELILIGSITLIAASIVINVLFR
jgi:preprotein translocase subunit Sec61beta